MFLWRNRRRGLRASIFAIVLAIALQFMSTTGDVAAAKSMAFAALDASLDTGSLAGTRFTITCSYDADQVSPTGESYVALSSFDFTLLDVRFKRNDVFQGGQAIFRDGVLENVTASFQVVLPPNAPVENITFGFGGPGVIAYIDHDNQYGSGSFTPDRWIVPAGGGAA